jgi:hypothetical protein
MATIVSVATGRDFVRLRADTVRWGVARVHSGQWNPTDAWFMQSGQMGRSQRWHRTPARRSVWR